MSALNDYPTGGQARAEGEAPRCLADITTRPVRRIDQRDASGHEGQCPECKSVLATPTALVEISVRRVASIRLARVLLDTGVTTLRSRGSVCTHRSHEEFRIVHTTDDALCPGWDGYIGVPIDCGPAGLQLVPIRVEELPNGWVEAVARGLAGRQDGGEQP